MINNTEQYDIQRSLEEFSLQYNHIQPINRCSLPYQMTQKNLALAKFIADGAVIGNQLTIIHLKIQFGLEHAVVKLECTDCNAGQPVIIYFGLYPSRPEYHPYFITECDNKQDLSWVADHKYQLALEKPNSFDYSKAANVSFAINKERAADVLQHVDEISTQCLSKYHYNKISYNCIDFAQDVYSAAGMDGDYSDHLYEELTVRQSLMFNQDFREWISFLEPVLYLIE